MHSGFFFSPFLLLADKTPVGYREERQLGAGDQGAAGESDWPCFVLALPFVGPVNLNRSLPPPEAWFLTVLWEKGLYLLTWGCSGDLMRHGVDGTTLRKNSKEEPSPASRKRHTPL